MADFMIRFLICNLLLCGIIGIIFLMKHVLKNSLSAQMQYHLWFLLLGLLAVPFIPFRFPRLSSLFFWIKNQHFIPTVKAEPAAQTFYPDTILSQNWMDDLVLSVNKGTSSAIGYLFFIFWISGILVMLIFVTRSALRLHALKKSALPLQSPKIHRLYQRCLTESGISRKIPVYSTAYLKSPVFLGVWKPCIYLPIHLISEGNETEIRYMLLHELQHYQHKDGMINHLMNLAGIVYWFNPLVRYAIKEMRCDQEVACDTSVLKLLDAKDYLTYGNTLINFAEKISLRPFPFTSGISGNMKQMKQRIRNIAFYEKPTRKKQIKSITAFLFLSILLCGFAPFVSTCAAEEDHYLWDTSSETYSTIDLDRYFGEYQGSFVFYDFKNDIWNIYDMDYATLRVAPNSTYKIYNALFGLESGIITPENSFMEWDKTTYPFEAWNTDQTLQSAMNASVNWYFQSIDKQLGADSVQKYLHKIGYGNEDLSGDFSSYWLESSLKISPIEQVELLSGLAAQSFGFSPDNINAVKNAIHVSSSSFGELYGKTGTGCVNGQDINGWLIGFAENADNTYFFATNIQANDHADGRTATEITLSVLSDMNIWK